MSRLIDADALLEEINELKKSPWFNENECGYRVIRREAFNMIIDLCINQMPAANQWISAEDRLPERNGEYLVSGKYGFTDGGFVMILSFAKDLYEVDEYDFYDAKGEAGWYEYDFDYGHHRYDSVQYWMPLPKAPSGGNKT